MNVVVCVKEVPDTAAEKNLNAELHLDRGSVENILNPLDEYAIEEALRIRERVQGRVTCLCMGPESAREALRKAIAMGVDAAVLVTDPALAGSDCIATAYVLSLALKKLEWDLLLMGMASTDAGTAILPGALAELAGLPLHTQTVKLELTEGGIVTHRAVEGGYQVMKSRLPALVSVTKAINEPRYPTLRGIMNAKRVEIPSWSLGDIGADPARVGTAGAATRVLAASPKQMQRARRLVTEEASAVEEIIGALQEWKAL